MNLAEALAQERLAKVVRVPCTVSVILADLTPENRAALLADLVLTGDKEEDMTHAGLSRALRKAGLEVSEGIISRHRNGLCACERR